MKKFLVGLTALTFLCVAFMAACGCSCERTIHIQSKPAVTKFCKCQPCGCNPCNCQCQVK